MSGVLFNMFFPWDGSKKSQYVFFRQETKCCFYRISKDAYVLKHTEKIKQGNFGTLNIR